MKKTINTHEYQTYNSQTGNKKLEESIIYYKMWTKICLGDITAVDFVITHVCRCKLVIVHISALYSQCIIYFNTTPTRFDRSPIFCFFGCQIRNLPKNANFNTVVDTNSMINSFSKQIPWTYQSFSKTRRQKQGSTFPDSFLSVAD